MRNQNIPVQEPINLAIQAKEAQEQQYIVDKKLLEMFLESLEPVDFETLKEKLARIIRSSFQPDEMFNRLDKAIYIHKIQTALQSQNQSKEIVSPVTAE